MIALNKVFIFSSNSYLVEDIIDETDEYQNIREESGKTNPYAAIFVAMLWNETKALLFAW